MTHRYAQAPGLERILVQLPEVLAELLQQYAFRWTNEAELQAGLEDVFRRGYLDFDREAQLGEAGRVDFVIRYFGTAAVEVKVRASQASVLRQLHRYAEHDGVDQVVLITPSLRLRLPAELAGKPAHTIRIPRL